jgi:hypothetical protein
MNMPLIIKDLQITAQRMLALLQPTVAQSFTPVFSLVRTSGCATTILD